MPSDVPILSIDVPIVETLAEMLPRSFDSVGTADYLLTRLLTLDAGTLHADFRRDDGSWQLYGHKGGIPVAEHVVATIDRHAFFRSLLARVGAQYMHGQLYGGHCEVRLVQNGRRHHVEFHMGNDQRRGYWIRAIGVVVSEEPVDGAR